MDGITLKKYFHLGDKVEVNSTKTSSVGIIVDFSDTVLVIEETSGNPIILSTESIISCKKVSDLISANDVPSSTSQQSEIDYLASLLNNATAAFDNIYESCNINNESLIKSNATVVDVTASGVEVETDEGKKALCVKSSYVGYSRENAASGKRVFCFPTKNDTSYATITEMTYGELYEKFIRAINTKPVPRSTIVGSILFYLNTIYGKSIAEPKKTIKQVIRKLSAKITDSELQNPESPTVSTKIKLEELSFEQKGQIYNVLGKQIEVLSVLSSSEQIKLADSLINDNLGFRVKRAGVKTIVKDIMSNGVMSKQTPEDTSVQSEAIKPTTKEDPFISATCEIKKYYPQYHNGSAFDDNNTQIRFKEDVVIDEDLKKSLTQCWNTPIPVICVFKTSKWNNNIVNNAIFVTKPGPLSEIRIRIQNLRTIGNGELADALQNYLEGKGYFESAMTQVDLTMESEELLNFTRRQRLIKNFEEAEKGFLEVIRREYSFDTAVRDLAMMYQEWKKVPLAIELLEKHLPKLVDKMKVYNMLFTFYHTTNHDAEAIKVMTLALELYKGDDKASVKKREEIEHKIDIVKKKKRKAHFSSDDIPASLLRYDANNTTGEVLAYMSEKSFDEKMLFLAQRIEALKNSPELPSYYLAKIQLLEDSGVSGTSEQIKTLLTDYCRAKARNFLNEGNVISAREYLLQGISIHEREDLYYLLLASLCESPQIALSLYNSAVSNYDEIVSKHSIMENEDVLYVLMKIFKEDTSMSRRLIRTLYEGETFAWICDELDCEVKTPNDFIGLLVNTSSTIKQHQESFEHKIENILLHNDSSELARTILTMPTLKSIEITSSDASNFSLIQEVANTVLDFEKNLEFDEYEDICRSGIEKTNQILQLIQKTPTQVSILSLLPLALKLKDLLERLLNKKYTETLPNIIVDAIDDARPIGDAIEIQVSVSNEAGLSRANNCVLEIISINSNNIANGVLKHMFDTPLSGGNKLNCSFTIKSSLINNDSLELKFILTYDDVRLVARKKAGVLSLNINKGGDYEDFENPYIAHVKSNAVKDKSMFKGRDEIIDTICKYVLEDFKGYVLYGQKRSGKSSVLYHITQRLRAEHKAFAVEYTMGNNIVQDTESENESMANLFYTIISEIGRAIKEVNRTVYKECGCHIIRRQEFDEYPDETFREYLEFYRDIIVDKLNYEQNKIVLIVDEFTYLYYHILEKKISPRIMEFWKGLVESRVFSFVFAGQDAMPRFMDAFQNVFASMHPQELTYIDEQSARELIEQPIWNHSKNCSRFHPDAVNQILKLTACSPFYIMILCSELVKYARQRKRLPIQQNDVDTLVQRMICNESSIGRKDFDNLISCGESRLDVIDKDDSIKVLKDIALKSRNIEYYDTHEIKVFEKEKVQSIIEDLLRRGVLERHAEFGSKVKIKVELFKRWLLNHE